jgi:hypothetical protein
MITAFIAPATETSASTAVTTIPGDWPGPALNDAVYLAQIVVAG